MAPNTLLYWLFFEFRDNRNNEKDVVDLLGSQLKPSPFREDGRVQIYNAFHFSFRRLITVRVATRAPAVALQRSAPESFLTQPHLGTAQPYLALPAQNWNTGKPRD